MLAKSRRHEKRTSTSGLQRARLRRLGIIDPDVIHLAPALHRERKRITHLTDVGNVPGAEIFSSANQSDARKLPDAPLLEAALLAALLVRSALAAVTMMALGSELAAAGGGFA